MSVPRDVSPSVPVTDQAQLKPVKTIAVIEVGTTAIRMVISEVHHGGIIKVLESLHQSVLLGKDSFSKGVIDPATIEDCVRVLRSFMQVLAEFRVHESSIKAVATSAIREAQNKDAVLDRIFVATGINLFSIKLIKCFIIIIPPVF